MKGQAFDIAAKGHTPQKVARYAQSMGITGIIQYNTFVHVGSRPKKYWARDDEYGIGPRIPKSYKNPEKA